MSEQIEYGQLMHDAMRGLVKTVLQSVAETGKLPGAHHFFITFDTEHPDVDIAPWLKARYPTDMTVVMQHWLDNLNVTDTGFTVTLNFSDTPEPLYIPYAAIKAFVDPSVEFGLQFGAEEADGDPLAPTLHAIEMVDEDDDPTPEEEEGEVEKSEATVISLDSFRKS